MDLIHSIRGYVMPALGILTIGFAVGLFWSSWSAVGLVISAALLIVGAVDLTQQRHSLLRNYPVLGHLRFLLEGTGPEIRQYFFESDTSGRPFSRDDRALVYERSKQIPGVKPFGTELDVEGVGYQFIAHSMSPKPIVEDAGRKIRIDVGGPACTQPYSASILNVSAMSFGALSAQAIRALNTAAKLGGFAHNTGEGGFSVHHRAPGGDIIWQVGTGYFGCRDEAGRFDAVRFEETSRQDQVKMIELKISQGAKPGHGGPWPVCALPPKTSSTSPAL